jgi:hypothetical protein
VDEKRVFTYYFSVSPTLHGGEDVNQGTKMMNHKTTVFSGLERLFENTAGIAENFCVPNVS